MADAGLPTYDELPEVPGIGMRHAWDVWGRDDVLGSINLVTAARVAAARAEIVTGVRYSLDLPLDLPDPPLYGRRPYLRQVRPLNRHEMDDHLDDFHPQGSTQWDALGHVRCREHGYWGGRTQDPTEGPNGLGIHHWTRHGIAGRGILLDVEAWLAAHDPTYDPLEPRFAGLQADEAMARFLWDAHPAALLCDNPAVERAPGDPAVGSLHRRLLPLLGFALGEMFDFDSLAAACAADRRWTFFFVAAPLHVPDGLGSPGNAMAIR
jgi:hypothetical protein